MLYKRMIYPAIVIAAYNRPKSLSRLLQMIAASKYPNGVDIPLVISIDGGGVDSVVDVAQSFEWQCGTKEVVVHSENLGLREHILRCGDLTEKYGAIIMLEDDLGVSRFFYEYAVQALGVFSDREEVAGISLYKHLINVNCSARFDPVDEGLGYYYLQFPQSWGQVWTAEQWLGFRNWYDEELNRSKSVSIPAYVQNWPETSWLKYFSRYIVDADKYFAYPVKALSTNFGDAGSHVMRQDNTYQVPLAESLPRLDPGREDEIICYDAFFEMRASSFGLISKGCLGDDVLVDLYGTKDLFAYGDDQLVLTTHQSLEPIKRYGFCLKPREMNVILEVPGEDIVLSRRKHIVPCCEKLRNKREFIYDKKWMGLRVMADVMVAVLKDRLLKKK